MSVLLETTLGDLVIDLHVKKTPQTCLNFIKLCKLKYYNFSPVFKLIKDFTLETGDPLGKGTGGECIYHQVNPSKPKLFKADMHPKLSHSKRGTVSMSVIKGEGDMDLAGSQFFITLKDDLDYLDGKYAIFGEVAEGFEVLDKINGIMCDEDDRPYQDIRILHTIVLDDPFPDPEGFFEPEKSPEPTKEQLETVRLLPGEELDAEIDPEEAEKLARQREAKVQSLTLEMLGDLPFAEIKPPENVLFVCKLNPITQSSDLELIFSRFGPISSCEIIRDQTTGDSLCYGFVEFDNVKDCEEAYFKMDNVLIDDRRIHVDFSQSVSKLHKNWIGDRMRKLGGNSNDVSKYDARHNDTYEAGNKSRSDHRDSRDSYKSKGRESHSYRDNDDRRSGRRETSSRSYNRDSDRDHRDSRDSRRPRDSHSERSRHESHRDSGRSRDDYRSRDRYHSNSDRHDTREKSRYRSRSPTSRSSRYR